MKNLAMNGLLLMLILAMADVSAVGVFAQARDAAGKAKSANQAANKTAANKTANGKSAKPGRRKNVKRIAASPEREAHVMTFVKRNHPELALLLIHLKKQNPRSYDRAIRDLYRASDRLDAIREKDPVGYELELNLWKVKSRAVLLATRYKMNKEPKLRKQLEAALDEQVSLQLSKLRRDHNRQLERLQRLEKQIQQVDATRQQTIAKQFRMLTQVPVGKRKKDTTRGAVSAGGDEKKKSTKKKSKQTSAGQ